jgi:hypothetical protein
MDQGSTIINGPHQGGLVDSPDGREWFLHFQDRGLYGRICHLQPVTWKDDWPVIGTDEDQDGKGEPVRSWKLPKEGEARTPLEASDSFTDHRIGLQWQWLGNLRESPFGEQVGEDGITLKALNLSGEADPVIWHCSNVLTQKLIMPEFSMVFHLDASLLKEGNRAGILMMGGQYTALYAEKDQNGASLCLIESEGDDAGKRDVVKKRIPIDMDDLSDLTFKMVFVRSSKADVSPEGSVTIKNPQAENLWFNSYDAEKPELRIFFQIKDGTFTDTGCRFTPSDHTWVGAKTGLFVTAKAGAESGSAAFAYVTAAEL